MATGQYLLWKDAQGQDFRPVALTGTDLHNDRNLNKGTAFTEQERADFELDGLLPPQVQTFEAQLERVYQGFLSACSDIEKYQNLRALQDRNETLFYALLSRHVEEMTPIIYTPTVGKACQEFSHRYQKARGLYITPKNVEDMGSLARHLDAKSVRIETPTPFVRNNSQFYPSSGSALITGAAGAKVRVTAINATTVTIDLDADGNGSYETTVIKLWSEML